MSTTQPAGVCSRQLNRLAVVSVIAAVVAAAGMFGFGISAAAAFAVGVGHVSLYQVRHRGDRGRTLALVGRIIGYALATWSFISSLRYIPTLAAEYLWTN